jgi:hypothetical protein
MKIKEKLIEAKLQEGTFQLNCSICKRKSKNIDKLKICDKYIYSYILENSISVYDINTFKEISNLKIPFIRGKENPFKEYIHVDILENGIVLILAEKYLYFYEINLKESQLKFLKYISEVYHFCILQKKKEIFLLTENTLVGEYYGMAKCDFSGNIIFRNKKNKPQIYYEYIAPKEIDGWTQWVQSTSRAPKHFDGYDGFNNDKYIINVFGVTDNWYKDIKYTISIYNSDNLKEIFNKNYEEDLRYVKINDNLFKKCYDNLKIFYYNEKNNTIHFINNITNIIYKQFNILKKESKNKAYNDYDDIEPDDKYFSLKNDNMFCFFDGSFLFIIDLSENTVIKKIDMKFKDNLEILDLCLFEKNGVQNLYISAYEFPAYDQNSINSMSNSNFQNFPPLNPSQFAQNPSTINQTPQQEINQNLSINQIIQPQIEYKIIIGNII